MNSHSIVNIHPKTLPGNKNRQMSMIRPHSTQSWLSIIDQISLKFFSGKTSHLELCALCFLSRHQHFLKVCFCLFLIFQRTVLYYRNLNYFSHTGKLYRKANRMVVSLLLILAYTSLVYFSYNVLFVTWISYMKILLMASYKKCTC